MWQVAKDFSVPIAQLVCQLTKRVRHIIWLPALGHVAVEVAMEQLGCLKTKRFGAPIRWRKGHCGYEDWCMIRLVAHQVFEAALLKFKPLIHVARSPIKSGAFPCFWCKTPGPCVFGSREPEINERIVLDPVVEFSTSPCHDRPPVQLRMVSMGDPSPLSFPTPWVVRKSPLQPRSVPGGFGTLEGCMVPSQIPRIEELGLTFTHSGFAVI
ncbi:hypothetical protein Cgig2_030451 [Carnegiea gigantea]|uniref:Uncharacterized protein n=1 Tax=Carnegiea gigantea TaxID=171969 RepID=A0A9Q1KQG1_9CARY|nr:hypothetical protein Cgig2_030451 [Carnegiea gigantea]